MKKSVENNKSNFYFNGQKYFSLSLFFSLSFSLAFAQSIYPNIDFENGNFSGWNAAVGQCCPILTPDNGFISGRQTIMSGNAIDPYTLGQVPVVAPNGKFSVRLGNDSIGAEAEKLSYTFTVLPDAPLFVYRYAVVFQFPPDHPVVKQPRFEISVKDQNGNLIECGFYQVACANNIPGFIANGEFRFKNWTDVGVDLTDYIGRQITIEFATGDCAMGGHFGYAYIDGFATELKITQSPCNPDGSVTLTAPPGFNYAWSTGDVGQQTTLSNPVGGSEISVTLTAATGCEKNLSIVLPDYIPHPDFDYDLKCDNEINFTDASSINNSAIINWEWNFGDGHFSNETNPVHHFEAQSVFPVTLIVTADNNCKSAVTVPANVQSPVSADFNFNNVACAGDEILFTDLSKTNSGDIISWQWNFDDHSLSCFKNPSHTYATSGIYHPELFVTTDEGCNAYVSKVISIKEPNECETENDFSVFIPAAFSPNGDGLNDFFIPEGKNISEMEIEIFNR